MVLLIIVIKYNRNYKKYIKQDAWNVIIQIKK